MGTVKIDPPPPIKPNERPTNAARVKPSISNVAFLLLIKMIKFGQKCGYKYLILLHTHKEMV